MKIMIPPVIQQMEIDANSVTTIANNISSMYSDAIGLFTAYTLAIVGLVGILIPILVSIYQWRNIKTEKENLERYIHEESTKIKSIIRDELKAELETELLFKIEDKFTGLEKELACAKASSFHLQGLSGLEKEHFSLAAEDFCIATFHYLNGGDELNGQRTLRMLVETCLPKMYKQDYEIGDLDKAMEDLITYLKENNENGRYTDRFTTLVKQNNEGKLRVPLAAA